MLTLKPKALKAAPDVSNLVQSFIGILGSHLVAIYHIHQAEQDWALAHPSILVVLASVRPSLLDLISPRLLAAEEQGFRVQVDTEESLLRGADAFPARTLLLCNHRRLLHGRDVLAGLTVERHYLRLHVEQGLRSLQHRLVDSYVRRLKPGGDLPTLRREVRRFILLLEGAVIAANADLPSQPELAQTVELAERVGLVREAERVRWSGLLEFAQGGQLERGLGSAKLYADLFDLLANLIEKVDAMEHP